MFRVHCGVVIACPAWTQTARPSSDTIEVEVASSNTIEVEPASIEPAPVEPEAVPAALPPRRVAAIAKDLFADVMALSEEERVALFT